MIASAQAAIAKVQALIQDNELKLANEKKKVEELEATKHRCRRSLLTILLNWRLSGHK